MKNENKLSLMLLIPVVVAFVESQYLPHFTGTDRYALFLEYLHFRGYLFLLLFIVAGLGSFVILLSEKPRTNSLPGIFGVSLCAIVMNMFFVWSAVPQMAFLNSIWYMSTEDSLYWIVDQNDIYLAVGVACVIFLVAAGQGYLQHKKLGAVVYGLFAVSVVMLPLPVEVFMFDHSDFNNHVTNSFLLWFTNADLFAACVAIGSLSYAIMHHMFVQPDKYE